MRNKMKRIFIWLCAALLTAVVLVGCGSSETAENVSRAAQAAGEVAELLQEVQRAADDGETDSKQAQLLDEHASYTSKDEVALYLHTYGRLPENYITKKDAEALGWDSKKGNLWDVAPGKSIGGSRFGNYEGQLPEQKGRKYFECDLDYDGSYRGSKRLVYSDDGLIFYTEDHYETFEQLY